jgi:chaperone protein EcpD
MKKGICVFCAGLLALCLATGSAQANVIVAGTRVIFPAKDSEVTLRLTNDNDKPALVEAWIDRGDTHSSPDKVDTPFLITPPLFRMDPHKDQSLRIIATSQDLPSNRESLFWLNVLEVPPKPTGPQAQGKNYVQLAIRSRLKFLYRPANLPGDPIKAPAEVTWKMVADGKGYALEVHNPTPYFITFSKVTLSAGNTPYEADTGMVEPMGTLRLAVKSLASALPSGTSIAYEILNDYGAVTSLKGAIAP